jgi:hypothetical protein
VGIKFLNCWLNLLLISPLIFLSGCASVKIKGASEDSRLKPEIGIPHRVTISPYFTIPKHQNPLLNTKYLDIDTGLIYIGRKLDNPAKPNELGNQLSKTLARTLEKEAKVTPLIKSQRPKNGIWIKGQMTQETQGSRALRTIVGLGAGKTKLDTRTYVYNLDKSKINPWLTIWTSGHSGSEPGALFSAMPSPIPIFNILGAASTIGTLINHSNKGLSQDAKRTGKVLAKEILKHTKL